MRRKVKRLLTLILETNAITGEMKYIYSRINTEFIHNSCCGCRDSRYILHQVYIAPGPYFHVSTHSLGFLKPVIVAHFRLRGRVCSITLYFASEILNINHHSEQRICPWKTVSNAVYLHCYY